MLLQWTFRHDLLSALSAEPNTKSWDQWQTKSTNYHPPEHPENILGLPIGGKPGGPGQAIFGSTYYFLAQALFSGRSEHTLTWRDGGYDEHPRTHSPSGHSLFSLPVLVRVSITVINTVTKSNLFLFQLTTVAHHRGKSRQDSGQEPRSRT